MENIVIISSRHLDAYYFQLELNIGPTIIKLLFKTMLYYKQQLMYQCDKYVKKAPDFVFTITN